MKKTYKNYEKEIQYVEKYSGLKFSTKQAGVIINELNLYVTDTLIVQNENKLILPSWTKKVFPVPLIKIKDQTFQIAVNEFKIKRLQAGPLLKSIAADMNMKTKTSFPQVFHFYSGHDITIITIMITLGIYNYITPPYAASLIFELRKKENENIVTLFRHGNRTPTGTYPTDPYQNYSWPNGLEQLTKTGEHTAYKLGKWFNKRYTFFIQSNLTYRHLRMDSSDKDRNIMSAQLFLAGFFPPRKLEMVDKKLLWKPIPVHTISAQVDNNSTEIKSIYKNYSKEIRYVEKHSGLKFSEKHAGVSINKLNRLTSNLIVQSENKLILPSWTKKVFPMPLIKIRHQTYEIATNEFRVKRLRIGPFLNSIATDMKKKTEADSTQVLHFYSSSDKNIASVMITLALTLHYSLSGKNQNFATDTLEKKYGKIIHASVLFRHANRTPLRTYPTDPYANYSWPNGLGQLTKTGQHTAYELGMWFNKRYTFFIQSNLTYRHLRMDSSDKDRSIMSAQLFLAGFFPPRKSEMVDKKLLWKPIPVHTISAQVDNNENKLVLPSWTKKIFPTPLIKIRDQTFQMPMNELKIKRLRGGPFLNSIATDMKNKIKANLTQVLHFYSGHDDTIAAAMITLGIFNRIAPPYAASLIFELRKKKNENIVTVLYKNSTTTTPYLMKIPKCGSICKLRTFLKILKRYIPKNWDSECTRK
ncbi:hypothetical protein PGB90_003688 [Kerria lacca]